MRLTAMVAMMAMAGMNLGAEEIKERVIVYLRDNASALPEVKSRAKTLAAKMFAGIGVQIEWHTGCPPASSVERALAIELVTDIPQTFRPRALAYAQPFERVHIQIFYDRIKGALAPTELLAHVMVHEITHILEGADHHSDSGIMKARWTGDDLVQMRRNPLAFAEEDLILIRQGLAARASGSATLVAANLAAAVATSGK